MYIDWHRNPYNKVCIAWCKIENNTVASTGETDERAELNVKQLVRQRYGKGYTRLLHMSPHASKYEDVPFGALSRQSYKLAYYVNPKVLAAKAKAAGIILEDNPIKEEESKMEEKTTVEVKGKEVGYISETKGGYIHIYKIKKYEFDGDVDYEITDNGKFIVTVKEKVNVYPTAE